DRQTALYSAREIGKPRRGRASLPSPHGREGSKSAAAALDRRRALPHIPPPPEGRAGGFVPPPRPRFTGDADRAALSSVHRSDVMKRRMLMGAVLLLGCGCSTMNNTDKGVLGGGALGALGGAAVGSAVGHTGAGAAIGAGLGAVAGGLTGNAIDRSEDRAVRRAAATQVAAANNRAVPLQEIVNMTQQHVSDTVIINQIRQTGSAYTL